MAPSILFVHENYPAQFANIGAYLASRGWLVVFATAYDGVPKDEVRHVQGMRVIGYRKHRDVNEQTHQYLHAMENAVLNGQGFVRLAAKLKRSGFEPDLIVAHSGWGSGSFAKLIWPEAKFVQYLEWWYEHPARDAEDELKPKNPLDFSARTLCRNLPFLLDMSVADHVLVPTQFQAAGVPQQFRDRLTIMHDGVNCAALAAERAPDLSFMENPPLPEHQVITYATRGMELYRGFPHFMAALARVQKSHKEVRCIIGGSDNVHYGGYLPKGESYKKHALARHDFDLDRIAFIGKRPFEQYCDVLRRSDVHVYLTIPFVLSWSCIEAMAIGAPIVGSDNPSVHEALEDGRTARLVNHRNIGLLTQAIRWMLDNPKAARAFGQAAQAEAQARYDAAQIFPRKEAFFQQIIDGGSGRCQSTQTPQPLGV